MRKSINLLLLCVVGLLVLPLAAQDKKPEAETRAVPDASKVKILQAQLAQEKLQRQFEALSAQLNQVKSAYPKTLDDLKAAEDEAYKLAGLTRDGWALDESNGDAKFVAKPEATVPPAKKPVVAPTVKP